MLHLSVAVQLRAVVNELLDFLFVFDGGAPGWQEAGEPATVETEILVSGDGASVVDVVYNGSPR